MLLVHTARVDGTGEKNTAGDGRSGPHGGPRRITLKVILKDEQNGLVNPCWSVKTEQV